MSTLPSTAFWLLLAAVALAVAFFVARNRGRSSWGFKDVVKNPGYWDGVNQARAEVDSAIEAAKKWDEGKVASFTRQFVFETTSSRDAWKQARILQELGGRTRPMVLSLLRDSTLYSRLVKPTGKDVLPEAPFNRACDLLGDSPGNEAVEALAPFLSDPSKEIRKDAALAVAKTGADTITPLVRKALLDEDEYVRSYVLMGLAFALDRSGLSESVQKELYPDVLALLRAGRNADKAAEILHRFDSERAKIYFLAEVFTAESPILHHALKALADAKVAVPRDDLRSLIAGLEAKELKYPKTYALGEALRLLGQQQDAVDRDYLRSFATHNEERVAEGAAAGLLCSVGLDGFQERIWDVEERRGYESLTAQQRLYSAVFMCDAEIRNGGFAQYFVNSSGDRWQDALAGLKAMGFQERLTIFHEALAKFGSAGPSTDRNVRQEQLSRLYKRDDAIFESLESRYYNCSEVVEVFTSRFVLESPEGFR